jgi:hypothetical protein
VAPNTTGVGVFHVGCCLLWPHNPQQMLSSSTGNARVTSFAAKGAAQTFDFNVGILNHLSRCMIDIHVTQPGDISYVPPSFGGSDIFATCPELN